MGAGRGTDIASTRGHPEKWHHRAGVSVSVSPPHSKTCWGEVGIKITPADRDGGLSPAPVLITWVTDLPELGLPPLTG